MKRILGKILVVMLALSVVQVSAYAQNTKKWNEYKRARHFIVYYKKAPKDFVKTVGEAAETAYKDITHNLGFIRYKGWNWDERVKIYIYDDQRDYVESGGQARWSHGVASAKTKEILTFPQAHGFFDSTLLHEMGHIIFREFVGFKNFIPLWFEEGVAMYQEKAKRWGSDEIVRSSIKDGSFMTIKELEKLGLSGSTDKRKVNLFYAESASLVYYLITEHGKHRFKRMCLKLQEGASFEQALASLNSQLSCLMADE